MSYARKKHIFLRIVITVFIIMLSSIICFVYSSSSKKEDIISFVQDNYLLLNNDIQQNSYENLSTMNIRIYDHLDEGFIDFLCDGIGFSPNGLYYGFYYSAMDIPLDIEYAGELSEDADGFSWRSEISNRWFYTEQIEPYFYYYEYAS